MPASSSPAQSQSQSSSSTSTPAMSTLTAPSPASTSALSVQSPLPAPAPGSIQALLASPLHKALWPPRVAQFTSPPDQDIALNRLRLTVDVDPRRVLAYMYNVTGYWRKKVEAYMPFIPQPQVTVPNLDTNEEEPFDLDASDLNARPKEMRRACGLSGSSPGSYDNMWWNLSAGAPLEALARILHACYPTQFRPGNGVDRWDMRIMRWAGGDGDAKSGVSMYTWSCEQDGGRHGGYGAGSGEGIREVLQSRMIDVRCCVFVLEPWAINDYDFNLFTKQRVMRNRVNARGIEIANMSASDKLWGMVYDRCHRLGCNWFVVTTHDNWAFGCLSKEHTTAFVTDAIRFDGTGPTVMQSLVYWIISSMNGTGAWDIDEVSRALERAKARKKEKRERKGKGKAKAKAEAPEPGVAPSPAPSDPVSPAPIPVPVPVPVNPPPQALPKIRYTPAEFRHVENLKRKRELDDIGQREKRNDRDAQGRWAPKPMLRDPPWFPKPMKCFPISMKDFLGRGRELASRLVSRTSSG